MHRQRNFLLITILAAAIATPALGQTVASAGGPGSGKTKTLTVKIAKLLIETVREPREELIDDAEYQGTLGVIHFGAEQLAFWRRQAHQPICDRKPLMSMRTQSYRRTGADVPPTGERRRLTMRAQTRTRPR